MNPRFLRFTVPAVVVALGFLPNAHAVEYTDVNPTASTINFTYNQMGSKVHGTFSQFVGALDFDTSHPEAAHAKLTIELGSIDAGSENANTELKKTAWFDAATHPVATFESSHFKDLGGSHYQITGNLTLKGVTREVLVQVLLKSEGAIGIFEGELLLKRGDFNVGVGEWSDSVVSDNITIRFRMVAPER